MQSYVNSIVSRANKSNANGFPISAEIIGSIILSGLNTRLQTEAYAIGLKIMADSIKMRLLKDMNLKDILK